MRLIMLSVSLAFALAGVLLLPGCGPHRHHRHHGQAQDGTHLVAPAEAAAVQNCPFMPQRPASKEHFVEHEGRRIHVCCGGCVRRFNEDPGKYVAMLEQPEKQGGHQHEGHGGHRHAECSDEAQEAQGCH